MKYINKIAFINETNECWPKITFRCKCVLNDECVHIHNVMMEVTKFHSGKLGVKQ